MKILIDGRVLAHDHTSGVQRHAQEIIQALKEIDHSIDIAIPKYKNRYYQQIWEHTLLPFYARKYDLLYSPSNIAPLYLPKKPKLAITLHDLAFLDFPEQYSSVFQKYYTFLVPQNLSRAEYVITISDFSKNRIIKEYPWIKDKISVVHHGISSFFTPSEELSSDYVLYVGAMNEIKNFQTVLQIFLMPEFQNIPLKMILPGGSTFVQNETTVKLLTKAISADNIEIIDFVDQNTLRNYYQEAKIFLFPSFHESFGFPPLEAMACGTPVIVSNRTALPEVCGQAALYVDPENNRDIVNKLQILLHDESLQHELIKNGLEHIKKFTWEKAGNKYWNIFQKGIAV